MDKILKIQKEAAIIEIQLFWGSQLILISVYDKNIEKSLLFEQQFKYQLLKQEDHLICYSWQGLCQAIQYMSDHSPSDIVFQSEGKVVLNYTANVYGNSISRTMSFILKKRMGYQEEVRILREKIISYESSMKDLRAEVANLKIENKSISSRLGCLEQQLLSKKEEVKEKVEKKEPIKQDKSNQIPYWVDDQPEQIKASLEQLEIKEENLTLTLNVDPKCPYISKFKLQNNTITSLVDDNFQVYWQKPLPKRGIVKASVKMQAKNHCSIGILTESELQERYSFRSTNSVCLYTYYEGLFRGLYFRGKYFPLEWMINVNETVEFEIDMTNGLMTISLQSSKQAKQVDILQLIRSQPIYFFLQMYEKDGIIQFI